MDNNDTTAVPRRRRWMGVLALLAIVAAPLVVAGSAGAGNSDNDDNDASMMDSRLGAFDRNQPPVDANGKSQLRANLNDIERYQIEGGTSWTYFFEQGIPGPLFSCPSIGDPIPVTDQITNPEKTKGKGSDGITTLTQIEPTGVFTGQSDGTNVICLSGKGQGQKVYWEGQVFSSSIELAWNETTHTLTPKAGGGVSEHHFDTGGK